MKSDELNSIRFSLLMISEGLYNACQAISAADDVVDDLIARIDDLEAAPDTLPNTDTEKDPGSAKHATDTQG